ncbi:hypothetical protein D3C72_1292140 [compost metagenome]
MVTSLRNSAWISAQTRSQISWIFTGRAFSGTRCGPLKRSTSACRRSASEIMTWVYSASAALGSSASSNCAAPRKPPRGFFTSWARLRNSSRCASISSTSRWLRSASTRCSISRVSINTGQRWPVSPTVVTATSTDSAARRNEANCLTSAYLPAAARSMEDWMFSGVSNNVAAECPASCLRERPNRSSAAALAYSMWPRSLTRKTDVASRSRASTFIFQRTRMTGEKRNAPATAAPEPGALPARRDAWRTNRRAATWWCAMCGPWFLPTSSRSPPPQPLKDQRL